MNPVLYIVLVLVLLALALYEQILPCLRLRRMAREVAQGQKEQQP